MKKQSKWMLRMLAAAMAMSLIAAEPSAYANTLNDLKSQQKELNSKKSEINSNIQEKKNNINANKSKQQTLADQINALDAEIDKTNAKIEQVQADIANTTEEIDVLKGQIEELKKKIAERDELLRDRIRAVQESGGSVNYLDVILGASSFADFIDRFSAVNTLMEADRKILKEQADDKQSLENKKAEVEDKLAQQEKNRAELLSLKSSLDAQKDKKDSLIAQLEKENEKLRAQKSSLEKEYSEIVEVSQEVQNKITAEQKRLAEIARKQEEERKRREAEARRRANASKGSSGGGSVPAASSGTWTRPASGRITSYFGGRDIGEGDEYHYGVDIANGSGTPIVAAADGIVSYASPLSTYGNVIMVTHSINGQIYTTVYAHLSAFNVSVGQSVSKGQVIARMGSTGRSTGPHVHFEVHIGTWQGQRHNAVNPLTYIN